MPRTHGKKAKEPVYYEIYPSMFGNGPGWELVNYDTLQKGYTGLEPEDAWPDGYLRLPRGPWRIPDYVETPRFLIDKKFGRPPHDIESIDGYFFLSSKLKAVFEAVDPSACEFRRCETYLRSGEAGPETWLCAVTRAFVGAVDIEKSDVRLMPTADGLPRFSNAHPKLKFKFEVIGDVHLFRIGELAGAVICDQFFKDACKAATIKGAVFDPITIS